MRNSTNFWEHPKKNHSSLWGGPGIMWGGEETADPRCPVFPQITQERGWNPIKIHRASEVGSSSVLLFVGRKPTRSAAHVHSSQDENQDLEMQVERKQLGEARSCVVGEGWTVRCRAGAGGVGWGGGEGWGGEVGCGGVGVFVGCVCVEGCGASLCKGGSLVNTPEGRKLGYEFLPADPRWYAQIPSDVHQRRHFFHP